MERNTGKLLQKILKEKEKEILSSEKMIVSLGNLMPDTVYQLTTDAVTTDEVTNLSNLTNTLCDND